MSHLLWSAKRGFAADNEELKSLMAKIANDGRKRTFKSEVPSMDAIRSFRARRPELRYRKAEAKETVNLRGENFDHVNTYATVLKNVLSDYPGIFDNGDYVWNMDETQVDGEFGERKKVYSPADTHHGGFIATKKHAGDGRHVTVVMAVSASAKKAPPFFIVEGKRNMSNWYMKLAEDEYELSYGHLRVLTEDGWFPSDASLVMAEKGSMEMCIIPLFMQHLNRFVRQYVPSEQHYVLVLDGHISRKGVDWLELAQEMNFVVVQSPANTSHFLQPCDQQVNKTFQTTVRSVRDALCAASKNAVGVRNIKIKLMLAVIACEAIIAEDIRVSWISTGLWPMDFKFPDRWRTRQDDMKDEARSLEHTLNSAGPAGEIAAVKGRKSDRETFEILATIVDSARSQTKAGLSAALQAVARCLQKHDTVQSILASRCRSSGTTSTKVSEQNAETIMKQKNIALPAGAPAEYLSHGDVIRKRKEEQAMKEAKAAAKVETRRKQAEERLEKEQLKQQRAALRAEAREMRKRKANVKANMSRSKKKKEAEDGCHQAAGDVVGALMSLRDGAGTHVSCVDVRKKN